MTIRCVWEHHGDHTLLYAQDYPGAFTRGETLEAAVQKMPLEIHSYSKWLSISIQEPLEIEIVQDAACTLQVSDADSDVLFQAEIPPLSKEEYQQQKTAALKSAEDFLTLYQSIPEKQRHLSSPRQTFYGSVPQTAEEMYQHTKNVNSYYFGEIEIPADNNGTILDCRRAGFETLEQQLDFLRNPVIEGSYGEQWTLRKVLRRFLWHDRIHARAMYRRAKPLWGSQIPDIFSFEIT